MYQLRGVLVSIALFSLAPTVPAHAVSPIQANCNKAPRAMSGAVKAAEPGVPTTVNVRGACVDNVFVPAGKDITFTGETGSSLTPLNATEAAVSTTGKVTLVSMNISSQSNLTNSNGLLFAYDNATIEIIASTIQVAAGAGTVVGIWNHSFGRVINSNITGTSTAASAYGVNIAAGSSAQINGDPTSPVNPTTGTASVSIAMTAAATGNSGFDVYVETGSSAEIHAYSDVVSGNTVNGSVAFGGNVGGLDIGAATGRVWNETSATGNMTFSNSGSTSISVNQGFAQIIGLTSTSNNGVVANGSNVKIAGSSFSDTANDIVSSKGSNIEFSTFGSDTNTTTAATLSCGFGGMFYNVNGSLAAGYTINAPACLLSN